MLHHITRNRWKYLTVASLLLVVLIGGWQWSQSHRYEVYATFVRPDGKYQIVVLRKPIWPSTMPGQAGDAPGVVRLYNKSGQLLHEAPVDMVQIVERVEWLEKRVVIKLIADWALPD